MLNLQYLLILKKRKTGVQVVTREIHLQKWRDGQRVFVLKYLNDFARNGQFNRFTQRAYNEQKQQQVTPFTTTLAVLYR